MPQTSPDTLNERTVVIACRVLKPELEKVAEDTKGVEIRYLDQGLHRSPQDMPVIIQDEVDRISRYASRIALGYGLCSNGIVGVVARHQGLFIPRCHDCIALFFGSAASRERFSENKPGTYYLTAGWVEEKKDPLGIIEEEYSPRLGWETALWVMGEELKHYTHIAFINTGVKDNLSLRKRCLENARILGKEYFEVRGSLQYFAKIIRGPFKNSDFLYIRPYERVAQEMLIAVNG